MPRTPLSRETLLPRLAAHVLEHGLAGASLRPLARAAGTSDRMLIYHFGSKDALVAALLGHLAMLFTASLDAAFPGTRFASRGECARAVIAMTDSEALRPFLRVWWDIVADCARGNAASLEAAGAIMDRLMLWVETHLPADDPDPGEGARATLTMIEGAQMLSAIDRRSIAKAALSAL